jgi:formylglycine-generating enzyme required for sulfatase activity
MRLAGSTSLYWWEHELGNSGANCEECGGPTAGQTLGSFRPNVFGLFDTAGNAAAWVEDCWNEFYHGAPQDGSVWLTGQCRLRVVHSRIRQARYARRRAFDTMRRCAIVPMDFV